MPSSWHTYDQYGYALVAIIGTFAAVAIIQWVIQHSRWAEWTRSLHGVAPPFINIIGVLFGLTLAFLANDTWSAHDRAMQVVYKEADALQTIHTLANKLPYTLQMQTREALVSYAQASVAEWALLARRHQSKDVRERADALMSLLSSDDMAKAAGSNVQSLMLDKASELRDERNQRIGLSQTHVNPLKWLGMAFLGLLTLLSVSVVHVDNPRAAFVAIMLFALAAAPTAAIVLIQGNPFQEPTAVTAAPIERAILEMSSR